MKLNTILLSVSAIATIANAGFFTHDRAYYDAHPKEAKAKFKACDKALAHALIDEDEKKSQEIIDDVECKAAHQAYKEHSNTILKDKHKARQKKKALEKIEEKNAFKVEYDNQMLQLKDLEYEKFKELQQEICGHIGGFGNRLSLKDAKCKAWKDLKQSKENEAVKNLLTVHPNEKILEYKNQICKNALYNDPKCELARKAFNKEKEDVIKAYLLDKTLLKKDFNACYHKIITLQKSSKYKESQAVLKSYKCYMASKAAVKLKIYGYFRPMK